MNSKKLIVTVTTSNLPEAYLRAHAQYHRSIGIDTGYYFIDNPLQFSASRDFDFGRVVLCDDKYWSHFNGRPKGISERQILNLQYARSELNSEWYLHLDCDEFFYSPRFLKSWLPHVPPDVSEIRIKSAERISLVGSKTWIDGILRVPNTRISEQKRLYGIGADFLGLGMAQYYHGKSIVRGGEMLLQTVHSSRRRDGKALVQIFSEITQAFIVHFCAQTRTSFYRRCKEYTRRPPSVNRLDHIKKLELMLSRCETEESLKYFADTVYESLYEITYARAELLCKIGLCIQMPKKFATNLNSIMDSYQLKLGCDLDFCLGQFNQL